MQRVGEHATRWDVGDRVGVPWLGWSCGECEFCTSARENLCERARFTGCHLDGGYAEYLVADERYCVGVPDRYDDVEAAPLLCAGLIGYRCYRAAGDARRIGLYGFGAAAHVLVQIATADGREVYAFTRPGDSSAQEFARRLGAVWAGSSGDAPPSPLDAAILFAPVGALVPQALSVVNRGGIVVCGGIRMSDNPSFPYRLLWGERRIQSIANLTRDDAERFMRVAATTTIRTVTTSFALKRANDALEALRAGRVEGAAVLTP